MSTDDSDTQMVNVNIEIPDELHRRLKLAAVTDGVTLKDLVATLLAQQD